MGEARGDADDVAGVEDVEGDAQEQMQMQHPSPPARLRSAAVSLLQNCAHVVFDTALDQEIQRNGFLKFSSENDAAAALMGFLEGPCLKDHMVQCANSGRSPAAVE